MANNNNVLAVNLLSRFATILLSPIFDSKTHITTKRFEGYQAINAIFPDAIIAELVAKKLDKTVGTEILFEELMLVRDLIYIPLDEDAPRVTSLKGVNYLANLKVLRMHHTDITEITHDLSHLFNLVEFDMTDGNLAVFPQSICSINTLERIRIRKQTLTVLPTDISGLTNLKILDVRENNITKIPIEIGLLDAVKILNVSNNPIIQLPNEIGYMDMLETLDVSHTAIATIPITSVKAKKLRVINVNGTNIHFLEDEYFQQMNHTIKIIGDQYAISANQLEMLEAQSQKHTKDTQLKQVIKQSITIAGVITTCVIIVVVSSMRRQKKNDRPKTTHVSETDNVEG